jgi:hypothetical protein
VVLTVAESAGPPTFDPGALRSRIDPHVRIYVLGTDDACRRLAQSLGDRLAVDNDDARIFWPGASADADADVHPLVPAASAEPGTPVDRLVAALELSRPGVRGPVTILRDRLQQAEYKAGTTLRELRRARVKISQTQAHADAAEQAHADAARKLDTLTAAGLDGAEVEQVAAMDTDCMLHRLICREWLKALVTPADREAFPLRYLFGPTFIESVSALSGTSLCRIAWVAAMVGSDRAKEIPGIGPHQLHQGRAGSTARVVRDDGAKAWRCKLNGEGASRLHYWMRPDGLVELATVAVHDSIGPRQ